MRNLDSRIEALELTAPRKSHRTFRVIGGSESESSAAFIRSQGQEVDEAADLVIHRVIVRPTPMGPERVDMPMRLTNAA